MPKTIDIIGDLMDELKPCSPFVKYEKGLWYVSVYFPIRYKACNPDLLGALLEAIGKVSNVNS